MTFAKHAPGRALLAAMLLYAGGALADCIATHNDGGTVQQSNTNDAAALRSAITLAAPGGTVKVAGNCQGAILDGGTTQVVLIDKALTLEGGYPAGVLNWTTSDPVANPTTLDGEGANRVLRVNAPGSTVTLRNLTVTGGHVAGFSQGGGGARLLSSTDLDGKG